MTFDSSFLFIKDGDVLVLEQMKTCRKRIVEKKEDEASSLNPDFVFRPIEETWKQMKSLQQQLTEHLESVKSSFKSKQDEYGCLEQEVLELKSNNIFKNRVTTESLSAIFKSLHTLYNSFVNVKRRLDEIKAPCNGIQEILELKEQILPIYIAKAQQKTMAVETDPFMLGIADVFNQVKHLYNATRDIRVALRDLDKYSVERTLFDKNNLIKLFLGWQKVHFEQMKEFCVKVHKLYRFVSLGEEHLGKINFQKINNQIDQVSANLVIVKEQCKMTIKRHIEKAQQLYAKIIHQEQIHLEANGKIAILEKSIRLKSEENIKLGESLDAMHRGLEMEQEKVVELTRRNLELMAELKALKDKDAEVSHEDRASKRARTDVLVTLSGIKSLGVNMDAQIREILGRLSIRVHVSAEFCENITHVIAPEGSRSMKVLAASLSSKWIMRPAWILESERVGYMLPEEEYGVRHTERPFKEKSFYISPAFIHQQEGQYIDLNSCKILIEKLGKGRIVDDPDEADYILSVTSHIKTKMITLDDFLSMIPSINNFL